MVQLIEFQKALFHPSLRFYFRIVTWGKAGVEVTRYESNSVVKIIQ